MTIISENLTSLAGDIRTIFVTAFGENSEILRLCRDHPDPFLHFDGKPVLNITRDEFVGMFAINSNRYSLPPVQASRFGTWCKRPLPNLVALVMKAGCERFLSDTLNSAGFRHDAGKIFSNIRNNSGGLYANLTYGQVDFIIGDLADGNKFLLANDQISRFYPEKEITEEILLFKVTAEQKETYRRLKAVWNTKSTGLDNMLLNLERKKRLNLGIENNYLGIFGNLEAEKSDISFLAEKYRSVLRLIRDFPGLSLRRLIRLAEEKLISAKRERIDLKNRITRSRNRIEDLIPDGTPEVSNEFREVYTRECKALLKKLYLLLHSDSCPGYQELSARKKNEINELWLELMKSTKDEMYSFSPAMLLYSMPDYDNLESIFRRACDILGIDPDCFEPGNRLDFMISKGSSIQSIIDFLRNETAQLELHLARLELIQDEYTNEEQAQFYRDAIGNREMHTEKLEDEIAGIREQIINLRKMVSDKFEKATNEHIQ